MTTTDSPTGVGAARASRPTTAERRSGPRTRSAVARTVSGTRSPRLTALREWLRPASVRRPSIPPLEAGLRPNSRLDAAVTIVAAGTTMPDDFAPDDVAAVGDALWCTSGGAVWVLSEPAPRLLGDFRGLCTALRADGDAALVAVEGHGIVRLTPDGAITDLCRDALVSRCVTDVLRVDAGSLLVAVGSTELGADEWARALVGGRRDGRLVVVRGGAAAVAAEGLAWPSGLALADDASVLISLSLDHRVERRPTTALAVSGVALLSGMAGYPGRARERAGGGWWIAVPYLRNRATELLLSDPGAAADMVANVEPALWLVPALRSENIYRDPLQIGQQRVMGVLKPWAPPRTYGLALRVDEGGRVVESVHSRPDGGRKGVTGVALRAPLPGRAQQQLVVACQGARAVVETEEEQP